MFRSTEKRHSVYASILASLEGSQASNQGVEMAFTPAEKLSVALLCDLAKTADERELDPNFISTAVCDGDLWAIDWAYPGLQLNIETPLEVSRVCDILEMWTCLENSYAALDEAEKARVSAEIEPGGIQFEGFDGNNETGAVHIARLLVRKLERWENFEGRDFNSHFPSLEMHDRLLRAFRPIWEKKLSGMVYDLSADELIVVMRERIHPEHRI